MKQVFKYWQNSTVQFSVFNSIFVFFSTLTYYSSAVMYEKTKNHHLLTMLVKYIYWICDMLCFFNGSNLRPYHTTFFKNGPVWSYVSWIYNYLRNQCLSLLSMWLWNPLKGDVLDITFCDKVHQWLLTGRWISQVSSTNKTGLQVITEIVLKVALKHRTHRHLWPWLALIHMSSFNMIMFNFFRNKTQFTNI